MRRRSSRRLAVEDDGDEEEEDEEEMVVTVGGGAREEQEPSKEALLEYQAGLRRRLMLADPPATGSTSSASSTSRKLRRADYPRLLLGRAGGLPAPLTPSRLQVMASLGCCRLPDALAGSLDQFAAPLFSAVFNRAGTVVAAACQDTTISLFDTDQLLYRQSAAAAAQASKSAGRAGAASSSSRLAAPPLPPLRPRKEIQCQDVGWSIIGSSFSPDGRWIAYSSWSRYLHLANTWGEHCLHEPYLVSVSRARHFCLFSLAFSSDGTRVVGGGNDGDIHVMHLERKQHSAVEQAHTDDVNAVCFLWPEQDSLLMSGSDDGLVKLWDLRTPDRARGLCVGHAHGVASVASKGNGWTVVSNGKDQTAKLWDLRRLRDASPEATSLYTVAHDWDYRWDDAAGTISSSAARRRGHGQLEDTSLLTFRGHRIARTLIQAAFSPESTTGGRFVLTGSADGGIFVFDTLASPPQGEGGAGSPAVVRPVRRLDFHRDCVRTVACSPHHDLLVSAGWDHRLGLWRFHGGATNGEEGRAA